MITIHHEDARWPVSTPRGWQREALPLALDALRDGRRGIIRAVMGAGKSILQAEVIAQLALAEDQVVLVTVPSIALTKQLAATIEQRLGDDRDVTRFCTGHNGPGIIESVNVVCHASLPVFARALAKRRPGARVIWIADEAHKTEARVVLDAIAGIDPMARLGFTATPWRSRERQRVSSFDELVYDYGVDAALRDGVVVPVRLMELPQGIADVDALTLHVAAIEGEGGIVNASSIADAEQLVAQLRAADIPAALVHSRTPKADAAAAIEGSRTGEAKVLVHVSMLAEGVDMPWLRWMIARRDVQSSVRFPQEIGRVLRSAPGKTEARLYDPHNLWGRLGLTLEAALGDGGEEPTAKAVTEGAGEGEERVVEKGYKPLSSVAALVSRLRVQLGTKHSIKFCARKKREIWNPRLGCYEISHWYNPASLSQLALIQTLLAKQGKSLPDRYKPILREVYKGTVAIDKGQASDLITALRAIKSHGAIWT